jgi:hypothetical protein
MQDASKLYFKKLFHNQDFKTEISGNLKWLSTWFQIKISFHRLFFKLSY